MLDDPLLHIGKIVVVLVKIWRTSQIELVLGRNSPGQFQQQFKCDRVT